MKTHIDGNNLFVVMEKGESVAADLRAISQLPGFKRAGAIVTALGLLTNLSYGYGKYSEGVVGYDMAFIEGPREIIGISGFVLKSEKYPFHCHISVSDDKMAVFGGHLFDAVVGTFVEMCILMTDAPISRIQKDGLPEMDFGK